jgi:CHASE3 domain sensor protein
MNWPWLRRGFDNGAATSLVVTLATVLIVGILSYSTIQSLLANDVRVTRSYETLDALSAVQADLRDAETGQRGYLLTGAESYLQPYRAGSSAARLDLDRLLALTRGDAQMEEDAGRLNTLAQAKLDELAETLRIANQNGRSAAIAEVNTGRGAALMEQARQMVDALRNRDRNLLSAHTHDAEAAAVRAGAWMFLGTIISSVLIITALKFVARYLRQRSDAEIENIRLSVLAEEFASRQRTFLRDVLFSVTEGRLRFCESPRELPGQIATIGDRILLTQESGLGSLRAHALEAARMCGIGEERGYDLITSACEAGMNAIAHAGGGTALICSDHRRRVQVWIQHGRDARARLLHDPSDGRPRVSADGPHRNDRRAGAVQDRPAARLGRGADAGDGRGPGIGRGFRSYFALTEPVPVTLFVTTCGSPE